jgi:D-alanyl-D-alanine carboxypeptidase
MATSYNGWPASPTLALRPLVVAGESFVPGIVDDDDVYTVLQYVAQQMHERVEPIVRSDWHQADDWGFNFRPTTGSLLTLSCHASGTAIDYNATRHPYDVSPSRNFSTAQITEIHNIIRDLPIVWGGDYRYHPDAMHFEIMGSRTAVKAAADRIRNINKKDGFDMAELSDLRQIVREELRDPGFIAKVGDEVWRREFRATNANGTEVKKSAREFLTSTWEAVKKLKP